MRTLVSRLSRPVLVAVTALLCLAGLAPTPAAPTPAAADASGRPAPRQTLRNPVREGVADPWLFHRDGSYFLSYTATDRIVLVRANSVAGLATAPAVTVWRDSSPDRCCGVWAPEFHFLDHRWYVYYAAAPPDTVSGHRMYVLESAGASPFGPYRFKGQLATNTDFAIDGTVLRLPNGRLYHVWSGVPTGSTTQNLYIAQLRDPWTISGPPVLLSQPTLAWERQGSPIEEGPVVLRRAGRTFLFFSASHCATPDYALGVLEFTGGDVLDPASWRKTPTPVFQRSDANWVFGTGHNSFVSSPDGRETWIAYHAMTSPTGAPNGSCGGDRSLRLDRVDFDADGTPRLGPPSASWQTLPLPSGDPGTRGVSPGQYRLAPLNNTGNALAVDDCSTEPGANVSVWAADAASPCQRWNLSRFGDGYRITNAHTGQALTVADCSPDNHADVVQQPDQGADCQRWYVDALLGGAHRISSTTSGRALDVAGCAAAPPADVRVWNFWQGDCQKWQLTPVT
ncbi:family 43 glycosylhydrolase [Goodfellowiella coeruleoviolacea]|uniref:Beta-xylosidase, GH43 family n=1 Tax=Goodfellowiella coeruleoviolacea TaxID=334858 RepID=A0AAE3KFQ1_9PSEU|nr:family 43 glycosylhydrolase [Goodfellowiella coeruleoviolacea]MCP2165200.1 Beta-xylosidase, GH43 family [Goodfellowiella coeruleoviolacea]